MAKQRYTQDQVIAALRETRGTMTLAADRLGCDPETVAAYATRYPRVRRELKSQRRRRVDIAELKLDQAIQNGEAWAIALVLKTLGKKRGYVERVEQEHSGKGGGPITVVIDR